MQHGHNYILISPVKDEERYVERTITAVVSQTLRPLLWILVDDESSDQTPRILERYARKFEWVKTMRLQGLSKMKPGAAEVRAFNAGYQAIGNTNFDYLVKLDCDLDLPSDYFERLVERFLQDPKLGIASGIYLEKTKDKWSPVTMPAYHAAGASKMMRRACHDDIGGLIAERGWDTVDEIRAQMAGWKTCHFEDLRFFHLKTEGSRVGSLRTSAMQGEVYYLTGGSGLFFLLKLLDRSIRAKPMFIASIAMLSGFLSFLISGKKRLVNDAEARFYRRLLNARILQMFGLRLGAKAKHTALGAS